jgi:hypothetical protein
VRRRGIEDVLHFFIPEEEQRPPAGTAAPPEEPVDHDAGAPRAVRLDAQGPSPFGMDRESSAAPHCARWGIPVGPEQLFGCALAVDLAGAFAHTYGEGVVLAPFAPPPFAPRLPPGVSWERFVLGDGETPCLAPTGTRFDVPAVVLWPPGHLARLGAGATELDLDGFLIPVDAAPWGLDRALRWIERMGVAARGLRLRVVLIGLASWREANEVFERLAAECRVRSAVELDLAGQIPRDRSSYRSLLAGRPVLEIDHEAMSARSLEELSRRLLLSGQTAVA